MRYFIAKYYKKPNGKFNEQAKLDTKVRSRDLQEASIIIDYKERKIVKSNFGDELGQGTGRDFDTINNFYKKHYNTMISQVEAKYEVLQQAMEMVSTVLDDEEAAEKVAEKIEDIAKDEEVTSDD